MIKKAILTLVLVLLGPPALATESLHFSAEVRDDPTRSLIIHGALDLPYVQPLLEDFHRRYPNIELHYRNFSTLELHQRFLDEDQERADVLISSAMPWQYRLANDGYAQALETPAASAWPSWARWRHELFGFTFEPIVIVYRRELEERFGAVNSHADLLNLLERRHEALRGRVVTYDPARSGAGYTYAIEEVRLSPRYWDLVAALGSANAALVDTTGEMLDGLAEGRYWLGYNLLGSYAKDFVDAHPQLKMVIPSDYALVTQRLAFIPREAPHPESARLFLDYLLSETGQGVISEKTSLGAVHPSLEGPGTAGELRTRLGDALRPIRLGPGLLATLDDLKREALLSRWQREFQRWSNIPGR
ncbi:iron ABC transporter [Litchfieldella qijiaojingensis]|uniref:Iron ABC transporter n=1 Tax=Litchfieldella qijiaojingensis TaxID=980347 RepID=A0ABQ2YTB5_9GAMM|nr:ABC transporter substrate-binding protein [Halomonas qijiaojingensis]GGX92811.1 iron ABC transporter [Halomonas qijiaojingensis]